MGSEHVDTHPPCIHQDPSALSGTSGREGEREGGRRAPKDSNFQANFNTLYFKKLLNMVS